MTVRRGAKGVPSSFRTQGRVVAKGPREDQVVIRSRVTPVKDAVNGTGFTNATPS